ncbi:ATP-binding protein [Maribellus mangrovi]|uniref:ATP-binding protein n=1 Tax=Maribellus mangrovi TaxID=3133146 RepID=UPI0030ECC1CB
MYINRKIEEEALKLLTFFPVIGIIGPRQAGKTTLVKELMKLIPKETIYLDLESSEDYTLLNEAELYLKEQSDNCVIIDEIQRMPALFPLLRSLIDRDRNPGRFIILGSASPELIRDSSESLAGRISYLELMPFSLTELPQEIPMNKHWILGGFPEALLSGNIFFANKWHESFVKTYIERDLPNLGFQSDPIRVERIIRIIASLHGQILNYSTIANAVNYSVFNVRRIINILEHAFMLVSLPPYFVNTKKRLVKSSKIYIRDSGILHYILKINDYKQLVSHAALGMSWEGYVIEQIRNNISTQIRLSFYRTQDQSEIDLIFEKGIEVVATAEIKYTATPKLSKGNTLAIQTIGCKNNFIITPDSRNYLLREDVRVCSLKCFLENYLPV